MSNTGQSGTLPPLVGVEWLREHHSEVIVADVRWYLDGRSARAAYETGHLPGAVFVDMDTDLSDHSQPATMGRHPLPSPEHFTAAMSTLGIDGRTPVVAYDDSAGGTAGRLVVMLRALGCDAALLDGGIAAWGEPFEQGVGPNPVPADFTPRPWPADRFATVDEVAAVSAGVQQSVLLDARAGERFRGESEPIDPRPGHIPAAVNAPWAANLDPATGRFLGQAELRTRYAALGASNTADVICYCGSGVSACADVLAIEHAGFRPPRLFVPSWSGWSSEPARPTATGPA
jgi:thiosulfate/3-mercaptopyruvate sulfurtransferase